MDLTSEEADILAGKQGEAKQMAMSLLVDVGEFFDAAKLISIGSAHISGVSYLTGGDGLIDQLELFSSKGAKVSVNSTLNPCGMDRLQWEDTFINLNFATKQFRILQLFEDLDVMTTCSCTPYDYGHLLTKGEHVAWAESSAVAFANSFFGARTNKEDSLSVLASAIIGKTPYYGFHLTENRFPNVQVTVDAKVNEYTDYSIVGEITGLAFKKHSFPLGAIPTFIGLGKPRPQDIKALGAALASFGTQLFHIKDVTPEQELLLKGEIQDELIITEEGLAETYARLAPPLDTIDLTVIGCPNANYEEIKTVTQLTRNKQLKPGKEFWLFTNSAQKGLAAATGHVKALEKAGVKVIVDTCPEVMPYDKSRFSAVLTNSVKAQHYISAPSLNNLPTYILPLHKCVEVMFE